MWSRNRQMPQQNKITLSGPAISSAIGHKPTDNEDKMLMAATQEAAKWRVCRPRNKARQIVKTSCLGKKPEGDDDVLKKKKDGVTN